MRASALLLLTPLLAAAGPPQPVDCIDGRDIVSETRPDDSTIIFNMRDHHVVYKNALPVRCFGLRNESRGFTYEPTDRSGEELCSNQVTIRLNTMQSICQLGAFTRIK